jgi:hypothetical protein
MTSELIAKLNSGVPVSDGELVAGQGFYWDLKHALETVGHTDTPAYDLACSEIARLTRMIQNHEYTMYEPEPYVEEPGCGDCGIGQDCCDKPNSVHSAELPHNCEWGCECSYTATCVHCNAICSCNI